MANTSKKKKRTAAKKNPAVKVITRYRNKAEKKAKGRKRNGMHRSRNPLHIAGFGMKQIAEGCVGAAGGAIATGALTEKVFGKHNEGPIGWLLNLGVAGLLGWGSYKYISPVFGTGVLFGGGGATVRRIWDEKVSRLIPVAINAATNGESDGKGMGDASFSSSGMYALNGYYEATYPDFQLGERYGSAAAAPPPPPSAIHHDHLIA
jgi:hypothetical protein